jgi:REP element-mobilizing transposase RayT
MSRRERPSLPGSAFHLTARLHQREALLLPDLRTEVVSIIRGQLCFSDVELLAYAVMPNHFHLVIRQGVAPLHRFMQPVMRRTARLVHRAHGRAGHVFERRYRDHACSNPLHLRNAIVYTHLNPVRAGLAQRPEAYPWTSHNAWTSGAAAADGSADPVSLDRGLALFATGRDRTTAELRQDYIAFVAWRVEIDRLSDDDHGVADPTACPTAPAVDQGDANWVDHFSSAPALHSPGPEPGPRAAAVGKPLDLADIARLVVAEADERLDLDLVRSRFRRPPYVTVRNSIIRRCAAVGYKGVQIAAYLRISPRTVSAVLCADRRRRLAPK